MMIPEIFNVKDEIYINYRDNTEQAYLIKCEKSTDEVRNILKDYHKKTGLFVPITLL